ncbi:hypothetical protein V8E53_011709 [Lactarius tabidus]
MNRRSIPGWTRNVRRERRGMSLMSRTEVDDVSMMMCFRRFRIPLLCGWLGYFVWRGTRSVFKGTKYVRGATGLQAGTLVIVFAMPSFSVRIQRYRKVCTGE